jgi:SAM-dependent methyltransferase
LDYKTQSPETINQREPSTVYDNPTYYEIAFAFRNIPEEVSVFEDCIERFSKIKVKKILELGCGPCSHMQEWNRRGIHYTGLDLNPEMIAFARKRAETLNSDATFYMGDMIRFSLSDKVDFACVLLGSLFIKNEADLYDHFDAVATVLKPGGLYFWDWCVQFGKFEDSQSQWQTEKDGVGVTTNYTFKTLDPDQQTFIETIELSFDDDSVRCQLQESHLRRAIFPEELLRFLETRSDFEFIGWWNNWNLSHPITEQTEAARISRPIIVMRRK